MVLIFDLYRRQGEMESTLKAVEQQFGARKRSGDWLKRYFKSGFKHKNIKNFNFVCFKSIFSTIKTPKVK